MDLTFYNFALAFVICAVAFVIGEVVSTLTKAWVPSVFVTAVVMLGFYWVAIPMDAKYANVVTTSGLIPFGSTIGIYLLITHMGTVISIKQLVEQWKTIVVCLLGLVGMCAACLVLCPLFMDRSFVIAGLPPLTGGIVAANTMMEAAKKAAELASDPAVKASLETAAVFAIAMYCVQGFAGYPLTAVCLQFEGKNLLKKFRAGDVAEKMESKEITEDGQLASVTAAPKKKLIPELPAKWNTTVVMLGKLGLIAWISTLLGQIVIPGLNMAISGAVYALVLGVIATALGFLETDTLHKTNSYGIIMFALMMYIFDGLKTCTPEMLGSIIVPMVGLIVVGVAGMAIFVFVGAKILKLSFPLALATALTALYGFPPNAIITESTCDALSKGNAEEKEYLMGKMFAPMIVGGFTTVTITSVIIAGIFANMF